MTPAFLRSSAVAAIVVTTLTGVVAAQERPSAILDGAAVQQLATRAEPADHERLAAHFAALAERYAAEANRHTAMAGAPRGTPARSTDAGMSTHFRQLADLNARSAATLRELAAYHQKLASGTAGTPPVNSTLFESGAGAPLPSGAPPTPGGRVNTPAEDRALQEYFATLAKRYTAEAGEHARLAQTYRGTRIGHVAAEHDRLAQFARNSAKQATAAADRYAQLANLPR